ncbi:MAG: hypothetical protein EPN75_03995 [Beijerinckiaceae bacterium]|nr:MAG: hypothetical protein EPN75_03995 [Beijerinckiaceae bacterium]
MLFTVVGVPSPFALWAIPALKMLIEIGVGDFDFIHLSTVEQLRNDWQNRKTEHVLLFTDCPESELAQILSRNGNPTIFLREDPLQVAAHCEAQVPRESIAATRITTLSFATLHDIALKCPNLKFSSYNPDSGELIRSFAEFFSIPLTEDQFSEIIRRLGTPPQMTPKNDHHLTVSGAASHGSLQKVSAIDDLAGCLTPFASIFNREAVNTFDWPITVFLGTDKYGAPSNDQIEKKIDLTGPARILFYGPYFHLPPGKWEIIASFHVAGNLSGNALLIEVLSGLNVIAKGTFLLPIKGTYGFTIRFPVFEPREPIQLRASLSYGAIEGVFSLGEVKIRRAGTSE